MTRFFRFEAMRYWKHHIGRAMSIVIAIVLGCASLTCATFLARSNAVASYQAWLNQDSNYDWMVTDVTPKQEQFLLQNAASKYQSWGMICSIGTIKNKSSTSFPAAYFSNNTARELYHIAPIKGDYPQKAGEIAISRKAAQAFGVAPYPGETVALELADLSGKKQTHNFTVSGILDTEKMSRNMGEGDSGQKLQPEVFVFSGQFADAPVSKMFLAQYIEKDDAFDLADAIRNKEPGYEEMHFTQGERQGAFLWVLGGKAGTLTKQMRSDKISKGDDERDFNSSVVIPIFSALIAIIMFLSIYDGVRAAMQERVRNLGMLRCVGLSSRGAVGMVLTETGLLALAAFPLGIALGVGAYALILTIQQRVFHMQVFFAFQAEDVIRATTLDPWIYPVVLGFVCVVLSVLIPALKMRRLSPLEAYREAPVRKKHRKIRTKSAVSLLNRRFKKSTGRNLAIAVNMLLVMSAAVFGFLFYSAQADFDNEANRMQLEKLQTNGADFSASKDFSQVTLDFGETNRHDFGISSDWIKKIEQSPQVAKLEARLDAPDTRLSYLNTADNQKYIKAFHSSNIHNDVQEPIAHMFGAFLKYYGYEKDEEVSNVPTVGLTEKDWKSLSSFVIEGKMDEAALKRGKEVFWVTLSDRAAKELGVTKTANPYHVSDVLPCSRVLLGENDTYDYNKGLSKEMLSEGIKDNKGADFHPRGKISRYTTKIGAVLELPDGAAAKRYFCNSLSGTSCFNMVCDTNAFAQWNLPDRNFTSLYVYLKNSQSNKQFEELWYQTLGNSTGMNMISSAAVKEDMAGTKRGSIATYLSLMIMLVVISLLSFLNAFRVRVRGQMRRIAVLRSIGMTNQQVRNMILRQNLKLPLFVFPFTILPVLAFDGMKRYANGLILSTTGGSGMIMTQDVMPWYFKFPRYDLFQQPVVATILIVLLIFLLVVLAASLLPLRWVKKQDIIQNTRADRF